MILSMRILSFIFIITFCNLISNCFAQDSYVYESSIRDSRVADPDEHGYRYCAHWKLADGTPMYSTCDPYTLKRCGKTLEFGFDCCSGFKKVGPPTFELNSFGNQVCAHTIPQWKNCHEILSFFPQAQPFAKSMMNPEMTKENPSQDFTIFAPQAEFGERLSTIYSSSAEGTNSPIFYHVVKGRFYASKLRNNQELVSYYQNQKLKVTKYSFGVVCIDCVEITRANFECKNSVIHFIRKPLVPRSTASIKRENIYEAIKSDPDVSAFANDIPQDLQRELQNPKSGVWYTVLPVLNENWNKIKEKYSGKDLDAIVRNHIILKLYCSAALSNSIRKLTTLNGEQIRVECSTESNSEVRTVTDVFGYKSKLITQDNMSGNGVYHTIEKAVVPLSVQSFSFIIKAQPDSALSLFKSKKYFDYIKDCDLKMEPGKKYAIFVPQDSALEWWKNYEQFKPEYNRFLTDKEYRCQVARYHITEFNPELGNISTLIHEQKGYKTNNGDLLHQTNYFIKNKGQSDLYIHYSTVMDFKTTKIREGSVFRISKINVIPEKFIVDILKENPKLSISSSQVQQTDMDKVEFKPRRPMSLFLATLDEGLKDLNTSQIKDIIAGYDGPSLKNFLLLHTLPLYLWGGDIGYFKKNTVHKFMSRAGIELTFWMDNEGVMRIGYDGLPKNQWAEVVKTNIHAKDGMVWILKKHLPCPETLCPHKMKIIDYDLFDVFAASCQYMELPGIIDAKDAKKKFNDRPIILAEQNPTKCAIYKQPTYKVEKVIEV